MRFILIENKWVIAGAAALTFALAALWQATGGDFYTKYEVVVTSNKPVDPNDPLAAAGFYSGADNTETVIRDEFRFGLLPTSVTPFDKHFVALSTLTPAIWVPVTMMLWWSYRRRFLKPGLNTSLS